MKSSVSYSGSSPEALWQDATLEACYEGSTVSFKTRQDGTNAENLSGGGGPVLLLQGPSLSHSPSPSQPLLLLPTPLLGLAFSWCTLSPEGGASGFAYLLCLALSSPSPCPQSLPLTSSPHLSGLRLYITSSSQSFPLLKPDWDSSLCSQSTLC